MLDEGIAAPLIEHAAIAAGMPVGPLAVLDETSLALSVHVLEQTRADLAAEGKRYEPGRGELLVERMVKEFKRPGRAGGGGFYDYPTGRAEAPVAGPEAPSSATVSRPPLDESGSACSTASRSRRRVASPKACSTSVHEANIGSIFGIGFPAWTGGAMQFIDSEGRERFEQNADALAARHGPRFALSSEVRECLRRHLG